jgi:hypothetical protein
MVVASGQHLFTLPFPPGNFFTKNNMTVIPHLLYSPDLAHCNFSVSLSEDKSEMPPF